MEHRTRMGGEFTTRTDGPGDGNEEVFSTGYSGNVIAIRRDGEGYWTTEVIYADERPLHHLVAGELDAENPGPELITCVHGGRVVLLKRSC